MKRLFVFAFVASSAYAQPGESRQNFRAEFRASQFMSRWSGYQNESVSIGANYGLRRPNFSLGVDLRVSNADGGVAPLGNLESLVYRMDLGGGVRLGLGRHEAIASDVILPFSALHRFNHRICYSGIECSFGGPTGASLAYRRFTLGLSFVSIPDITPGRGLDSEGRLVTQNRWGGTPYQTVEIDGHLIPLRTGVEFQGGMSAFFKPGARLSYDFFEARDERRLKLVSQFAPSQSVTTTSDQKLGFAATPTGEAQVVVKNDRTAYLEYEQAYGLEGGGPLFGSSLRGFSEAAYARKVSKRDEVATGLLGIRAPKWFLEPSLAAGVHREEDLNHPFIQISLLETWGRFAFSARSTLMLDMGATGWWLSPAVTTRISKSNYLRVSANLIQSSADAYYVGDMRANDEFAVGWIYAF